MTYFELFNIPLSLTPDRALVRQRFYELSRKYHPDFFTLQSGTDQAEALDMSSLVNKAFKTFQSTDDTIKYVLQLKGLLVDEEKYQLPPGFLMEMLELNEALTDAKTSGDAAAVASLRQTIADTEAGIYQPVQHIIEHYDDNHTTPQQLLQIKDYYFKKKYLDRILATL